MAILNNSNAISSGGYDINNSLRFRKSASAYLSRTIASPTNNKKWTYSCWVKRGELGSSQYTPLLDAYLDGSNWSTFYFTDDKIWFYNILAGTDTSVDTVAVFRDPSAWYHIVFVFDSANATTADRGIIYVNGVRQTVNNTYGAITLNEATYINNSPSYANKIGIRTDASLYMDGYLTEINFIDGQALTPSSFGETFTTTGSWIPKKYTGSYGTNGFYLKFADASAATAAAIGKDSSGNGNNWTPSGISVTAGTTYDAMKDSPTNTSATVANYCTINPLRYGITYTPTVSEGNLKVAWAADTSVIIGTMNIPSSGKWYWEAVVPTQTYNFLALGVVKNQETSNLNGYLGTVTTGYGVYVANGNKLVAAVSSTYMAIPSQNTVVTVAFDADTGTLYIGAGGLWANGSGSTNQAFSSAASIVTGLTGDISPAFSFNTGNAIVNFGQRPFTYTPPTGYVALNTFNLPTPTILQGNKYMDATLWTGNGASTIVIVNQAQFKPDMVWAKSRSNAYSNLVWNSIVGAGTTTSLITNTTDAEGAYYGNANLTSFNSNGFSTGATSGTNVLNANGVTNVAWQWQAGQGSTSSNTSGTITSTTSVNTTAGFSVVTWTATGSNATIGHGLGVAPKMIITKGRNAVNGWNVYTSTTGNGNYLRLDTTAASTSGSTYWNNTSPTSTVFSTGTWYSNTETYVAYCWAEIAGFSKFGSYTGNGSTNGTFVYTGFLPRWVLIKQSSSAGNNWQLIDTARETTNPNDTVLFPNTSGAEGTGNATLDFLSNGFKVRTTDGTVNTNGSTYIYAAFASNPFKNANAR